IVNGTFPQGLGEPMNIIISAESDSEVLVHSADNGGFLNLMLSTFLASECLGQHLGDTQAANLGESSGNVTQVEELRWDFNDPYLGTCRESFEGGLHARYWIQNSTGAYFIATSVEMNAESGHDIILDGYNLGRDFLAGNLTGQSIPTLNVSNSSTFSGVSTFANYTYQTDVKYVSGLLPYAADMINHYLTVESSDRPPIDGLVAVLTVKIISKPPSSVIHLLCSC
ncbi:hypothetical protein TREMEDRAFT_28920, partial [Tremella mesenterica DSM 1558]|uniref:uncharacterized protein n=1 Tax=Tremella mesenterica (strain ATCC 24925 / CBS 8224 / DSM 1558 / NBRC 9311 / NRRL Y-6157 / RJB 2259-6 / UBC 559-6) TaxID=578456 RepID=UPI0003F49071